jgi:poly(A)-specific ribonuclease
MNVTRFNSKRALPLIVESLRQSDFIAIDFEFSGLQADQETLANHLTDCVDFRYWKYKQNISQFSPLQIGICGFKYSPELSELECRPFNFYMLPHASKTFLSQVSSLDFLASHGFNFNKLVYESCRYVSISDYAN